MIINIDAFKKAENIINQAQDKLNGETAMCYIRDTNPIELPLIPPFSALIPPFQGFSKKLAPNTNS